MKSGRKMPCGFYGMSILGKETANIKAPNRYHGFPGGSVSQESRSNAGDLGSVPGLGRSGEGNGNPL